MVERHEGFKSEIAKARLRFEDDWEKAQRRRFGPARRKRDPGAEFEPAPVGPTNPSNLSGGAEAPLDP